MLDARDFILRQLDAERDRLKEAVASGAASSYDDYKHMVGQIQALDRSRELIIDGFRDYDNEDDDDGTGL
jgi:hypothetical protein